MLYSVGDANALASIISLACGVVIAYCLFGGYSGRRGV